MSVVFWILAILVSFGAGYWVYRTDKKRTAPYPWVLALLRTSVVFLTLLLLLAPLINITRNETQKPVVLFLQDNSESIAASLNSDSTAYKQNATALLNSLKKDYRVIQWGFGDNIQKDSLFLYRQQVTDISKALSQAVEYYGQQNLGAIVLATDGRFNQGLNPQFQELSYQGSLYTAVIGDTTIQKDIRIQNVYANKTVALNSQFEIRADVLADHCKGYTNSIRLQEVNGDAADNVPVSVTTDHFDNAVSFSIKATTAGLHHYTITAPAADGEKNVTNNRKDIFVEVVSEKKNILIAAAAPHPDINAIREALSGLENYTVSVRIAGDIPADITAYQIVILHSLPTANIPLPQVTRSNKAVWYIMGLGTDVATIAQTQIARLNLNTFNLQNNFPQYQSSFTAFTMPANINAVMDRMPPLASPTGSATAGPNSLVLFSSRNNPQPLWLLQEGSTPKALLLGEGLWRWRMYEYRFFNNHLVVDEAIRQTVSFLSANVNDKPFRVELPKYIWSDREAITMNAYLLNANNEQVNPSDVHLTVTDSAGRKESYTFERSGSAYRINIGTRAAGNYSYAARTVYNGKSYAVNGNFSVHNMPLEMQQTGADYPLLYHLSRKYDGAAVMASDIRTLYDSIHLNPAIKPVITTSDERIPLIDWKWFFFLILLLAMAEWLLRKYWMAQ